MHFILLDPTIVIQPENASTVPGASVTLSCGVVGSENLMNVKWMKNNKDLTASSLISFSEQTWQNVQIYSLKILKVKKRHLGNYHCVVTNTKGTVTSNVVKVSLTRKLCFFLFMYRLLGLVLFNSFSVYSHMISTTDSKARTTLY